MTGCAGSIPVNGSFFGSRRTSEKRGSAEGRQWRPLSANGTQQRRPSRQGRPGKPFAPSPERRASGQCPEVDAGVPAETQRSGFGGRGGARERSEEYPSGCSEWSGLCDDEGRVQGDNACSGVQRVKPLAQVGLMLASIHTGLLSGAKHSDSAASPPLTTPGTAKKQGTGRRAEWQKD